MLESITGTSQHKSVGKAKTPGIPSPSGTSKQCQHNTGQPMFAYEVQQLIFPGPIHWGLQFFVSCCNISWLPSKFGNSQL